MNCPYCDMPMDLSGILGIHYFCVGCGLEYRQLGMILLRKNDKAHGWGNWSEVPEGCLITISKFTEEIK